MARRNSSDEIEQIVTTIARLREGGSVDVVLKELPISIPRRTVQRYLALLVRQERIRAIGEGRGRRYRIVEAAVPLDRNSIPRIPTEEPATGGINLAISQSAKKIQQEVLRPIQNRRPVGYNRAFLNMYKPNKSAYLSPSEKEYLMRLGRSTLADQPAGTYARQIFNRLLIDLSWNSSRLEGNTYSLLETQRLIELGESAEGKKAFEAQMILNHKAAIELLVDQAAEINFNRYTILNLHAILSDNLLSDPRAGGRLRQIPVSISGSVFHPLEVPQLIDECFEQILDSARAIVDPFEQAFFVMVHIPYLQPFEDVNKRVSRLAANISLVRNNLSPLSFIDVPENLYIEGILGIYEQNRFELLRDVFIWAYERSCARYSAVRQSLGEPDPLRLRYRSLLIDIIGEAVRSCMNKKATMNLIKQRVRAAADKSDRSQLITALETELSSLHEGNIARYRIRPSEYTAWQKVWR